MKKLISIVLVFVMLLSVALVPAFAENTVSDEKDYYYWHKIEFEEKYGDAIVYDELVFYPPPFIVDEALLWTLIEAVTERVVSNSDEMKCFVNGDLVFHEKDTLKPFNTPYSVYDEWNGTFTDITSVDYEEYILLEHYILKENIADLIGDLDGNKEVSILDVTQLQCVLASLAELEVCECVADFNRDGAYDILDATAIQLKLAGIE